MAIMLYLNEYDVEALREFKKPQYPKRIRQKAEALILHAHGHSTAQIASIMGFCEATIRTYFNEFKKNKYEIFEIKKKKTRISELFNYEKNIKEEFSKHPPLTADEARTRILKLTGVKRGLTQIKIFLKKIGMSFKKSSSIPGKCDPIKQEEFKKKR